MPASVSTARRPGRGAPDAPRARTVRRYVGELCGFLGVILLAEVGLRFAPPEGYASLQAERRFGPGHPYHPQRGLFTLDEQLGFVPSRTNPDFAEHGALHNEYPLEKRAGWTRLLFLGDSVTQRGKLVEALRDSVGDRPIEFWNAGVGGFSTYQEAGYYSRIAGRIQADHVILTFHLKDFGTTPTIFLDADGQLVMFEARGVSHVSPWLMGHSRLYRLFISRRARDSLDVPEEQANLGKISASLARLRDETRSAGVEFSVLLLPMLAKPGSMPASVDALVAWRMELALGLFDELGLRAFDLTPPLEAALAADIDIQQNPGDVLHPSEALCAEFASWLLERGLLQGAE